MNIQIFGKSKCFSSKAAERFFRERKIAYQYINVTEKGMAAREIDAVYSSVKDIDLLFDTKSPLYESLNVAYISRSLEQKKQLLQDNASLIKTPIVRNCTNKQSTIGASEAVWKSWLQK